MRISQWWKGIIAAVAGVFGVLVPLLDDGAVTGAEWVTLTAAVLGALGVLGVPNSPTDRQRVELYNDGWRPAASTGLAGGTADSGDPVEGAPLPREP